MNASHFLSPHYVTSTGISDASRRRRRYIYAISLLSTFQNPGKFQTKTNNNTIKTEQNERETFHEQIYY